MSESNKEIAARYLDELHNKGNFEIGDELVVAEYKQNNPHVKVKGMSGNAQSVQPLRRGFLDYRLVIEHQVAEGDKMVS